MTDIEKKVLEIVNASHPYTHWSDIRDIGQRPLTKALCDTIEQHEAFRREVSDAVWRSIDDCGHDGMRKAHISSRLSRFIIAKPDPLVEALAEAGYGSDEYAVADLRAALAARGLEIREVHP